MTAYREWPSDGGPHTSDSIGQALAGLVARDVSGNPIPGMIAAPSIEAVSGAWKVQVGRLVYVRNVAGAARFSGLSAAEQVDLVSAAGIPSGQARIDRVCWDPVDSMLVALTGTPAAAPTPPSDGGLVRVLQVLVNAGDGAVIQGQITPEFEKTRLVGGGGSVGGVIPARSVAANGLSSVAVVFPEHMFTSPPQVLVTMNPGSKDCVAYAVDVTTAGCTIWLGSHAPASRILGAMWRAFGDG